MSRRSSSLVLALALLVAAGSAQASTFLGYVRGNVNHVDDLLRFDAIGDVTGIHMLGIYDDSEDSGNILFPGGDPIAADARMGPIVFTGDPVPDYFTVKAGPYTGLYSYMPSGPNPFVRSGPNAFDTNDFSGKGFSAVRFWGDKSDETVVPEPTSPTLFAVGSLLVALGLRRRA